MLLKQTKLKVILYSTFFGLSILLNACGNSQQIEQLLSTDPGLQAATKETAKADDAKKVAENRNSQTDDAKLKKEIQLTKLPKDESETRSQLDNSTPKDNSTIERESAQPFADLPKSLPLYPPATLEVIAPESTSERGVSNWRSQDDVETIVNYYRAKWQDEEVRVIQPFESNSESDRETPATAVRLTAIVRRDNLDYTISLTPNPTTEDDSQAGTNLKIAYQTAENTATTEKILTQEEDSNSEESTSVATNEIETNNTKAVKSEPIQDNSFTDLAEVPEQLREYVGDLAALGIITPQISETNPNTSEFNPNETITRREYAKWLVKANNQYYADSPRKKIHLANQETNVAFKDIGINDPDFAEIQGLAEAGLIPSVLSGDSSNLLFQPDAPLTRENLIAWKVPLDTRKALPQADVTAVREAWGFQDANNIDAKALQALFADYQNSDRSNVNRIFGYTTLFQPKKPVTRAEAAASLWYFGFQGDGITAKENLNLAQ